MTYNWRLPLDKGFKRGPAFGVVDSWHPNGHRGTDYNGVPAGAPCKAVGDGEIVLNQFSKVLGNIVVLKVGKWYFGYCHLVKPSPLKVGAKVKSGDTVGGVGTTGSASSGNHLHFTLSLEPNGVIGGKVFDAHTFIEKMMASEKKASAPAVATTAAPASVKHCATCACKE
jgi:murein DD-endopeptidase MepM/ murein hydrolase activator NlpD